MSLFQGTYRLINGQCTQNYLRRDIFRIGFHFILISHTLISLLTLIFKSLLTNYVTYQIITYNLIAFTLLYFYPCTK